MIFTKIVVTNFRKKYKIVIYVLDHNSACKKCYQSALKLANFELLRFNYLKSEIPTAWGLMKIKIFYRFSGFSHLFYPKIVQAWNDCDEESCSMCDSECPLGNCSILKT